jgi:hypothetical protein
MKPTSPAPTPATPSEHADHDLILIAAHAAGDTVGADRERAAAQVAHCSECAGLAADLVTIAAATRALPAPLRTRDFRLSPEAASRASRRGLRGLGGLFGAANLGWARPLAATLTTLGLAGLVVSAAPVLSLGFGTGAAVLSTIGSSVGSAPQAESGAGAAAASAAAVPAPAAGAAQTAAPAPEVGAPGATRVSAGALLASSAPASSAAATSAVSAADNAKGRTEAQPGGSAFANEGPPPSPVPGWVPWVAAGSTLFLIAGLSLFTIRWRADRGP